MVDVPHDVREGDVRVAVAVPPPGRDHPTVQRGADDAVAPDDGADLIVGELPLMGCEGAAVVVARQDRAGIVVERLPEGLVGAVREVEDDPQAPHLGQERLPQAGQPNLGPGPAGVPSRPEVTEFEEAKPALPPLLQLGRFEDGVRPFHADDESQAGRGPDLLGSVVRMRRVPRRPLGDVGIELSRIADQTHVVLAFQGMIVRQLPFRDPVGLCGGGEIEVGLGAPRGPCKDGGEAERDPAPAHFRERHRALPASFARGGLLLRTDRVD